MPIIAWEIERHERPYHPTVQAQRPGELCVSRSVLPITLNGDEKCREQQAIRQPDGRFDFGDHSCDTEVEALADLRQWYDVDDEARRTKQRLSIA